MIGTFEFTPEKYEENVLAYLKNFASEFHLDVYSYLVESSNDENIFQTKVKTAMRRSRKNMIFL